MGFVVAICAISLVVLSVEWMKSVIYCRVLGMRQHAPSLCHYVHSVPPPSCVGCQPETGIGLAALSERGAHPPVYVKTPLRPLSLGFVA